MKANALQSHRNENPIIGLSVARWRVVTRGLKSQREILNFMTE